MSSFEFIDYVIIGSSNTDFIINLQGKHSPEIPGGSSLYTAGGLKCWKNRIGVISEVLPKNKITFEKLLARYDIDTAGLIANPSLIDDRRFFGYISTEEYIDSNPVAFYASKSITFPASLIGYEKSNIINNGEKNSKNELGFSEAFPRHYLDAGVVHLCSADLQKQIRLSSYVQQYSSRILTIESSKEYMLPSNWEIIPVIMKNLSVFFTSKAQLASLFKNRLQDHWEMAEYLCSLGCDYLVMNEGLQGQYLYDNVTKQRYQIPSYPTRLIDPTGMAESFCGGFMAAIKDNYDPLEASLHGNISASITGEGTGPFYNADSIPGLLQNRLAQLRKLVTKL